MKYHSLRGGEFMSFDRPLALCGPLRKPHQMLAEQEYGGHSSIHDDGTAEKLGFRAGPINTLWRAWRRAAFMTQVPMKTASGNGGCLRRMPTSVWPPAESSCSTSTLVTVVIKVSAS
jgi:hypothetical protein